MFKTKQKGFTLIELLVVIVIIGILSTISTATFKSYFGKARDAERQAAVQNIAMMVKVDSAQRSDDTKFDYATVEKLKALFDENDFKAPKSTTTKCYYYGFNKGDATKTIAEDNEFVILVPGEDDDKPFVDGTIKGIAAHTTDIINASNCATKPVGVPVSSDPGSYTYIRVTDEGTLETAS